MVLNLQRAITLQDVTSILLQHLFLCCLYKCLGFKKEIQIVNIPRSVENPFIAATELNPFKDHDRRIELIDRFKVFKPHLAYGRISNHKALFIARGRVGIQCCCDSFGLFFPDFRLFKFTQAKQRLQMSFRTLLVALIMMMRWTYENE